MSGLWIFLQWSSRPTTTSYIDFLFVTQMHLGSSPPLYIVSFFFSFKSQHKCHFYKEGFCDLLIRDIAPALSSHFHVCFHHSTYSCLLRLFGHLPPLYEYLLMYPQHLPHCLINGRHSIILVERMNEWMDECKLYKSRDHFRHIHTSALTALHKRETQ